MRIDDFLPLVDDYALFPLVVCQVGVGPVRFQVFYFTRESGFVFFLIICYLEFYNSYPRLAQIWVLTQLIPNGKTKKTWLWDLPSLEQACQASCLTAYINNHNLLSGYDKYKFSMQGIYKHHSSNVLLFDRKLEVLFQKKNQDEELPIYLPSPHF